MNTCLLIMAPGIPENVCVRIRLACEQAAARRGETLTVIDGLSEVWREATFSEQMTSTCSCVIAAGGDGTVAAVAHVLIGRGIPLGIIPVGTGNLVARELKIPMEIEAAVALQFGPRTTRCLDVMRIQDRIYLLNAGVGVNAAVATRTSRSGKSFFGIAAYVGIAIWNVLRARLFTLTVNIDGQSELFKATDVLISNCGLLARGLHPNGPDILPDDGHLDVCVVCMRSPLQYPWHYMRRWLGCQRAKEQVVYERIAKRTITLSGNRPLPFQADGDPVGLTPITVELLCAALDVICPEAISH